MIIEISKKLFQKIESVRKYGEGLIEALERVLDVKEVIKWQYEYHGTVVNEINFEDYLKERGEDGWELVFASGDFVGGRDVRMIWKKQK